MAGIKQLGKKANVRGIQDRWLLKAMDQHLTKKQNPLRKGVFFPSSISDIWTKLLPGFLKTWWADQSEFYPGLCGNFISLDSNLLLILPAFMSSNNNFKTFFTNLSIWLAIALVIFSLYYFYNLYLNE